MNTPIVGSSPALTMPMNVSFAGSNRYVLDYLASEVVHQQSSELRLFLTRTALLDRFNADLGLALTGREDSQDLINHLEELNLFIVALDDERRWFRYHHLFAVPDVGRNGPKRDRETVERRHAVIRQ